MSTRSITKIIDDGETLVCLYRQCDGYPDGHGLELARFLVDREITNGLSGDTKGKTSNGFEELAAQFVTSFKRKYPHGNIYLTNPNTYYCGQEYTYMVLVDHGSVVIVCYDNFHNQYIFNGTPKDYISWVKKTYNSND